MKRVCKPGGLVAARDCDYDGFRWYPDEPAIPAVRRTRGQSRKLRWTHVKITAITGDVERPLNGFCHPITSPP